MNATGDIPPGLDPKSVRILVAEDSPVNQQVALKQLQAIGFQADAVADGSQVLEAFDRAAYDIILMDCHMPEMNGYETTWQIRDREARQAGDSAARPRTYIIAMTANTEADNRDKCRSAGMDDYINKPVRLAELEAVLLRAVSARAGTDHSEEVIDPVVIAELRQMRRPNMPDPLAELIELFLRETPKQLDALEGAASSKELTSLSKLLSATTSLKGSAGNLGAHKLAALCDEIEQGAKSWTMAEVLPLIQRAREEFARVKDALEKNL